MTITMKASGVELTEALKAYAEEKIGGLDKYRQDLMGASVELERTTNHHNKGDVWRAEGNISAPKRLFRAEYTADDLYAAIDGLKDALKRELQDDKERMQDASRVGVDD